uniref:Uncharacterized protein n=1 Tax=Fervidicoccus fontis TaxID=683846 RepID=A0A7J3ZIT3_9CREN
MNIAFEGWKKRALQTLAEIQDHKSQELTTEASEDLKKLAEWIPKLPLRDLRVFISIVQELSQKHKIPELLEVLPREDERSRIRDEEYDRIVGVAGD